MKIGKINKMKVITLADKGITAEDPETNETIFISNREVKGKPEEGDEISVFLYKDAKRETIATMFLPYAVDGEFEFMTVKKVVSGGALLDWGIDKDLFLPNREQTNKIREGRAYLVYVHYDEKTEQVIATMHLDDYMSKEFPPYKMNDEVDLLITRETNLGYQVIVDDKYWGLIYHNEIFERVDYAMRTIGFIKNVREDGKIDVALQKQGYQIVDELSGQILEELEANKGFLPYNDNTESDVIYNKFGCSKKSFKKTIGTLYRQHAIVIEERGIRLVRK
ncbi:MAG: GntR family transcriptional regulator [Paludibacteraceae bacterium]|nr:GntR family transcriptional regulator [Paludibacteraceae bacterium]MEE3484392.1 S1-like domain-containing RNA-binding protein [Bacteroidales bacterium]